MGGGLSFNDLNQLPEGMRKLIQEQAVKTTRAAQLQSITPKAQAKAPKYHNKPTERVLPNGEVIKFASKKEASRYDYLSMLQKTGIIRKLRLQYQFLLKPSYIDGATGERFRGISYLADFVYEQCENGEWVQHIEDTKGGGKGRGKGTRTAEFSIKRKLMAEQGYMIEVVDD